jgi:hypothetical protein
VKETNLRTLLVSTGLSLSFGRVLEGEQARPPQSAENPTCWEQQPSTFAQSQ